MLVRWFGWRAVPVVTLLMILAGGGLLIPLPGGFRHLLNLDCYAVAIAVVLAVVAMYFQMRGWSRVVASVSLVFALFFLMRMRLENHEIRWLYRVHAVAPMACQEAFVNGADAEKTLVRALELAGLPPNEGGFLLIACKKNGAETSITNGFEKSWTLLPDGSLWP
ncbi:MULTISPECIES: hypothetical protein [Corallococcus]|uniref:hypothetical protein n=1 Tax=Corallococcus TaxID=83461 RepID=UPI0011C3A157|nr:MULTISPECIES: hypothetical protein [Corallococcus]